MLGDSSECRLHMCLYNEEEEHDRVLAATL